VKDPWEKVPLRANHFASVTTPFDARLQATSQELLADNTRAGRAEREAPRPLQHRWSRWKKMRRTLGVDDGKNPQAAAKMIEASANLVTDAGTTMVDGCPRRAERPPRQRSWQAHK
jgi:hypothetical protein